MRRTAGVRPVSAEPSSIAASPTHDRRCRNERPCLVASGVVSDLPGCPRRALPESVRTEDPVAHAAARGARVADASVPDVQGPSRRAVPHALGTEASHTHQARLGPRTIRTDPRPAPRARHTARRDWSTSLTSSAPPRMIALRRNRVAVAVERIGDTQLRTLALLNAVGRHARRPNCPAAATRTVDADGGIVPPFTHEQSRRRSRRALRWPTRRPAGGARCLGRRAVRPSRPRCRF